MTERMARRVLSVLTVSAAIGIPASALYPFGLNPTLLAGATIGLLYLCANPQLLTSNFAESRKIVKSGVSLLLAPYLGALLMLIGLLIEMGILGADQ